MGITRIEEIDYIVLHFSYSTLNARDTDTDHWLRFMDPFSE